MRIVKKAWNHPACERFLRLAPFVTTFFLCWHEPRFLFMVVPLMLLFLVIAGPAGLLSRDSLKRSWGWLFIRSK